jgi:formate/nitrite transporter FocA (FNT family)
VLHVTGNLVLAALAFGIGFVMLGLANSGLFTENFLVPVSAVMAGKALAHNVARLWGGTLGTNLAAGWLFAVIVAGLPYVHPQSVTLASFYPAMGTQWRAFAAAILAGALFTLLTWVEHA